MPDAGPALFPGGKNLYTQSAGWYNFSGIQSLKIRISAGKAPDKLSEFELNNNGKISSP
jgi:hypothetical protein